MTPVQDPSSDFIERYRAAMALKQDVQSIALKFLDLGFPVQAVKLGKVAQSITLPDTFAPKLPAVAL